ncbi:MAG: acetylornithine transaminase [Firmicutes bacterium]|nr:acetylornithine transaminase [Bacillota bacterium]MDD4264366.1 acetylornithine transaminase [Bacillota bacterium]MDD4692899.1 acetylornithine transaminase [Bacillota bacterium]
MILAEAKKVAEKYLMNTYSPFPVIFTRGRGSYLYDQSGKEYLDLFSGIAVNNLGYSNEKVVEAIIEQANKLMHTSNLFYTEPMLELAKALVEISELEDGKVFFCNSGTEANEGALKLARLYGKDKGKFKIVSAWNSFHGRTLGGLTLTGQTKYHEGFKPLVPEVTYTVFNDLDALSRDLTPDTAALFLECVQGEGGVVPATKEYLQKARELCDKYDILLIFDEVQTGVGRTGKFFAYENFGIKPDVVTMAKALGGGLPLGAIIAKGTVSVFTPGKHASTFGGNPVTTSAALTVVKEITKPGFLDEVLAKGEEFRSQIPRNHPLVKGVRGLGLMLGIETTVPASKVVNQALSNGLVIGTAGLNVIRLLPPLTITKQEMAYGIERLIKSLDLNL